MTYLRVIPRDLFNEASLLKCLGRLSLLSLDRMIPLEVDNDGEAFDVYQDEDGALRVRNITARTSDGRTLDLWRSLNARDGWPLYANDGGEDVDVFNDDGQPSEQFLTLIT